MSSNAIEILAKATVENFDWQLWPLSTVYALDISRSSLILFLESSGNYRTFFPIRRQARGEHQPQQQQ
jgi:hypothetical protein